MDNQKTGALITERRGELSLTQKQLAEQLHLSDRTISRWERGVGFPDISLLEPLADSLGLSVLELLRGERLTATSQEAERSARETIQNLSLRFKHTLYRFRGLIIALLVLLLLGLGVLIWLLSNSSYAVGVGDITAAEAVSISQDILITSDEYALLAKLLASSEIQSLITKDDYFTLDNSFSAPYQSGLQLQGNPVDYLIIEVMEGKVFLSYGTDTARGFLIINSDGSVEKTIGEYKAPLQHGVAPDVRFVLMNKDNITFRRDTKTFVLS